MGDMSRKIPEAPTLQLCGLGATTSSAVLGSCHFNDDTAPASAVHVQLGSDDRAGRDRLQLATVHTSTATLTTGGSMASLSEAACASNSSGGLCKVVGTRPGISVSSAEPQ